MATLIVYISKYGSTEKCAQLLADKLVGDVELCNLRRTKQVDLALYDKVIVGGSIYMGRIQKAVKAFCEHHGKELIQKKLGLFICCMRDGDVAETELMTSFEPELLEHAITSDYFGGEFQMSKMNFIDRFIVKKVSKVESDTSSLRLDQIHQFAEILNAY